MKKRILVMLLLAPMLMLAQVKGKKSKKAFETSKGTTFRVGDYITLNKAGNENKFAYAYENKSMFSLKNITKAVKSIKDAKNLNVTNISQIGNTLDKVTELANNDLVNSAMTQLMGKAISTKYVEENALDTSMESKKFKIKFFKIYSNKGSDEKIVHAIAKGNGKTVAILLEFAEKTGEI
ncbi:MAG: hypothetical protein V3V28_05865 [Polaribacter sp.]|uniref:hypothetical protein n=1 Tax=Polaribacter sp. TaxID=1920175 RepID=UPI002F3500F6